MFIRRLILLALLLALPGIVHAQGSRKDDIVLNRFGQPVAGASITVCTAGATGTPCSPLASIYSDVALSQPLSNPLTADGQGNYHFYAAPGRYMIQISGAGTAVTTIPDVILAADPTSPSFQSLSVTQNINALNLNLSGNLSVSGGVSSPTTVSAPQQGSAAPVQLGAHWSPGTATGLCSVPAAPTVQTESISSGTGNFASGTTYYVKVTLFNRNGQTTSSPAASYTPASGSTNRALVQLADDSYRSGCYGMRVYISGSGSGGPFYEAQAWTLPQAAISSWSRNAAGLVTVVTSAAHGFSPGQYVTIAGAATGGSSTSINGSFYIVAQQGSSPTKLFFFQSSSLGADSGSSGGTGTVIAGLGSDSYGHIVPGDFIVSTVPVSGTQPPGTNTAMIDADQVALNATCNYSTNACASGRYDVPQGSLTATTPLIVSNQQTVAGINSGGAGGKSERYCNWSDPNLGCVMVIGTANGVRISGMDIESACNGILLTGSGPGFGSSNDSYTNNSIVVTGPFTGTCSAIRYQRGVWYEQHWSGNFLGGDLADVIVQSTAGADFFFAKARWNAANLSASGLSTNFFLGHSSVSDPDRGANYVAFPAGLGGVVEFSDFESEQGTGVGFECINVSCKFRNVQTADSVAIAGTPALVRFGTDANGGGNGPYNFAMEDSQLIPVSGVSTALQFLGNYSNTVGTVSVRNTSLGGNPNDVDFNNVSLYFTCSDSTCSGYESATAHKLINIPSTAIVNVRNSGALGNPNTYGANLFTGGLRIVGPTYSGNANIYLSPYNYNTSHSGLFGFFGDPLTQANQWLYCFPSTGADCSWYQNDGSTKLFELNASNGANQINLGNPGSPANNKINLGLPLVDSTGATVKGALSATSGSIGGSALAAGACTSGTVSVTGASTGMAVSVSPAADPGAGFSWMGFVSSSGTVTVRVCAIAAGTPASTTYNVRVNQ